MGIINIEGNILDPQNPGHLYIPHHAFQTNYILVELKDEIDNETLAILEDKNAAIMQRVDEFTWLVYYTPWDLEKLASIPAIENALVYLDYFVIEQDLKDVLSAEKAEENISVAIALHAPPSSTNASLLRDS
ncbi:uncharacterized protein KY384_005083 [Bacidia gigantensis]|uniref:uncharacterized protein n=1 Tax=Bacidia gigantensis TaxID=2732470 RepID=UPI001D046550|nr:uncharacterized protein KY384_005083 [Bacidia gigantensis]KAG8530580.1 hypothetical protein KY384_005083 [Bacidia gigantensis]